jgi:cytochrome b561
MIFLIEMHYVGLDVELFEELHEFGEVLIPVFLIMHVGAVILHYLKGDKLLAKINPF